jgi:16S rRNA processing protein RimM
VLGRVLAPHGVRGWLKVYSYADPPAALLQQERWALRDPVAGGADRVESHRVLQSASEGQSLRVALEGIADRDAAQRLCGWEILIERAALPAAAAREYFCDDLVGCTVRNGEGAVLGTVQYFLEAPGGAVMIVRGEREYAVPALPPHLQRVDLERREIAVDWPADF